jgi:capsular polysaccharide biosynthesis protein
MSALIAIGHRLYASGSKRLAKLLIRVLLVLSPRHYKAMRVLCVWAIESKDYSAAENMCRKILKVSPDEPGALSDLGRLLLLRGAVGEAVGLFQRHAELTVGPGVTAQALRRHHLDIDSATSKQPYFKRLTDVLVDTAYWTIIDGDVIYSDDTHGRSLPNNPLVQGRLTPDGQTVIAMFAAPRKSLQTECIFVGGDENYSHWVFRNLLKLSTLDNAGILRRHSWLVNSDLRQYQREYLALLGIDPDDLILVERNDVIRCRKLVVPALLTNRATIRAGIDWMRARVKHHMLEPKRADRRIYVSRRDTPRRVLLNEDELFTELSALGFELVVPGELPVVEQITAFSSARLIVATHGAGMTNMLFAPYDAGIIEITSTSIGRMDDFRRIARSMGQRMITVVSDRFPANDQSHHANSDYFVDVGAVLQAVRQILN